MNSCGGIMATTTVVVPDSKSVINAWRKGLAIIGGFAVLISLVMWWIANTYHQVTKVYTVKTGTGNSHTVTVTGPPGPSTALITTLLGAGVIMILVAALFARITKIVFPWGGEVDLGGTSTALKRVIKARTGDTKRQQVLYKKAAPVAAQRVADEMAPLYFSARQSAVLSTQSLLDDDTLNEIVDEVDRETPVAPDGAGNGPPAQEPDHDAPDMR
jgi:hypothetical protein